MKIFRTMLCTLCQNYLSYYNMPLCGFHCILRYSICILVISHVFLLIIVTTVCSTGSSCSQTSAKWVQTLIFRVVVIMNDFSIKRSLYFSVYFTFWVILVISYCLVMTCVIPSQNSYVLFERLKFCTEYMSALLHFNVTVYC